MAYVYGTDEIAELMTEMYGEPPCSHGRYEEFMHDHCRRYCKEHCNDDDIQSCWEVFIDAKLGGVGFE